MENVQNLEDKKYIKGELLYTIFHNDTEHFSIAKIKVLETTEEFDEKEIVIKGHFSTLNGDTTYYFYGEFERHPKFGIQYRVTSYQTYVPDTEDGLVSYLSSDLFYGVGKRIARRIVKKLGTNAINKILADPDCLNDIKGLSKDTKEKFVETIRENQGFEHVVVNLAKYQLGLKMAQKIYEVYKEQAIEKLHEDPYQFVFDVEGFGFQTADEIAKRNGLSLTHPNRIGAACIYVLQASIQEGHVYLPLDKCIEEVRRLLTINSELKEEHIVERIEQLNKEKKLIVHEGKVYLPTLYYAEDGFTTHLHRIIQTEIEHQTPLAELLKIIGEIEEEEVLSYGNEQFEAINQAIHSKVMILTGGPGTGKTTVIKGILKAYAKIHNLSLNPEDYKNKSDFPFILAAPTGRAAKRLNESTGLPASTIHRLLGWNGVNQFEKDEDDQLTGTFLIIDEFSMVDIWLANSLFKAIPRDMQVLLVGDEDQLPSVGPGQVLSDLLKSGVIPFVRLNEVYRQKDGSKIIQLAHEIKNNICTEESLQTERDFSFIPCKENQMIDAISTIIKKANAKGIDYNDIQVLAPMYRSQAGINAINAHLQQLINPKTNRRREIKVQDVVYRVGDRVIQLVNQPEDGIYNGDIGEIVAIFKEDENIDNEEQIVIAYDDREVAFVKNEYDHFTHAYCISIHKSQGSEFPIVVFPVLQVYNRMLRKNLLYTAITRSKKSLIICGEKEAFIRGIRTMDTNKRYTSLQEMLNTKLAINDEIPEVVENDEELSPYDFME